MNNDNPILNNPYEEPRYHYNADIDGNLDYSQRLEGRRPYIGNIQIPPIVYHGNLSVMYVIINEITCISQNIIKLGELNNLSLCNK